MKKELAQLGNEFGKFYDKVFNVLDSIENEEIRQELKMALADVAFDYCEFERQILELESRGEL